jgi:116 kDa U5 small nuclear ribonucleoprotein component
LDPKPLLKLILGRFFGDASGFVEMVASKIPSPAAGALNKVSHAYTGTASGKIYDAMLNCDASGPLMINVVKLYSSPEGNSFHALGRIYSGTLRKGDSVRVLGESYSMDDEEDMAVVEAGSLSLPGGRYRMPIEVATAGNWVLIDGVDAPMNKTATICSNAPAHR